MNKLEIKHLTKIFGKKQKAALEMIKEQKSKTEILEKTGATVVALKSKGELLLSPGPYATVRKGDILYFVGDDFAFSRMKNLFDIL